MNLIKQTHRSPRAIAIYHFQVSSKLKELGFIQPGLSRKWCARPQAGEAPIDRALYNELIKIHPLKEDERFVYVSKDEGQGWLFYTIDTESKSEPYTDLNHTSYLFIENDIDAVHFKLLGL